MDKVFDESLKKLSDKRAAISGQLSDRMSQGMLDQLISELAADANRDDVPDIFSSGDAQDKQPGQSPTPQVESNGKF